MMLGWNRWKNNETTQYSVKFYNQKSLSLAQEGKGAIKTPKNSNWMMKMANCIGACQKWPTVGKRLDSLQIRLSRYFLFGKKGNQIFVSFHSEGRQKSSSVFFFPFKLKWISLFKSSFRLSSWDPITCQIELVSQWRNDRSASEISCWPALKKQIQWNQMCPYPSPISLVFTWNHALLVPTEFQWRWCKDGVTANMVKLTLTVKMTGENLPTAEKKIALE